MKPLFYRVIKVLVRAASRFMFSEVEIRGLDRMPTDRPCVVSPNHVNSFLDALLIGAFAPIKMHYLTRADVFGTRWEWVLEALQMVPVYRRRDGYDNLARNEAIFDRLRERMREGESVLVFSEAAHARTYSLRSLSKGSARFALEAQAAIDRDVCLVPVGLTYYHFGRPGFKVALIVGAPISVSDYADRYRADGPRTINDLRADLTAAMKECLLVPEKTDAYEEQVARIHRGTEDRPFPAMKEALKTPETLPPKEPPRPMLQRIARWLQLPNLGPMMGMRAALQAVDDPVFTASLKFAVGMIALPVWWILLFAVTAVVAGWTAAGLVTAGAIGAAVVQIQLIRHSRPPHVLDG